MAPNITTRVLFTLFELINSTDEDSNFVDLSENNSSLEVLNFSEHENLNASLGFGVPDTVFHRKLINSLMALLLTLIGITGSVGNGVVIYIFTRYRRLRAGGGPLILSLAAGDLLVSILHILPAYSSYNEAWAFGKIGCEMYAGAVGLGGLGSLVTLSVIAADRFSVIFGRPVFWLAQKTTCVCIWCLCLTLILPPFFGWSSYVYEGLGTSCSWDYTSRDLSNRLYYIFLLSFGFLLPISLISVSYVGISVVVCRHSQQMSSVNRNGVLLTHCPTKTDLRTAQVAFTLIACYLVSWTPYAIVSLIGQFGPPGSLSQLSTALPAIFAKASVVYNPIVYGLSHPHFRYAVKNLWTQRSTTNQAQLHYYGGGCQNTSALTNRQLYTQNGMRRSNKNNSGHMVIGPQRRVLKARLHSQPTNSNTLSSKNEQISRNRNSNEFKPQIVERSSGEIVFNRGGWSVQFSTGFKKETGRKSSEFDSICSSSSQLQNRIRKEFHSAVYHGSKLPEKLSRDFKRSKRSLSKQQWKYFLMHQRDCCECSYKMSSSSPQEWNISKSLTTTNDYDDMN